MIGVDDNAPYRVFYDASQWPAGTKLEFLAAANDLNGHYSGAFVGGITANYVQTPQLATYKYAVVHYNRPAGDYDGWGLHLWGDAIDPTEATDWGAPKPFLGEDAYGRFAWIKLATPRKDVNFIVHNGDDKDTPNDRKFNPAGDSPEIWLKQGDANFYTSQAAAQGFVTIHYNRPDGNYAGWGLHLWGDAIDRRRRHRVGAARGRLTASMTFGAYWNVPIKDATKPVNFIIHNGDDKDPGPDQSLNPAETAAVWIKSATQTIYPQLCAADRRRRSSTTIAPPATTATTPAPTTTTSGACTPGAPPPTQAGRHPASPPQPTRFGPVFRVPLDRHDPEHELHSPPRRHQGPWPRPVLDIAKVGLRSLAAPGRRPRRPVHPAHHQGRRQQGRPEPAAGPVDRPQHDHVEDRAQARLLVFAATTHPTAAWRWPTTRSAAASRSRSSSTPPA